MEPVSFAERTQTQQNLILHHFRRTLLRGSVQNPLPIRFNFNPCRAAGGSFFNSFYRYSLHSLLFFVITVTLDFIYKRPIVDGNSNTVTATGFTKPMPLYLSNPRLILSLFLKAVSKSHPHSRTHSLYQDLRRRCGRRLGFLLEVCYEIGLKFLKL